MSVNADQTFSGDSIFENIYVHGKLVSQEEAVTIFRKILAKELLQSPVGIEGSLHCDPNCEWAGVVYFDGVSIKGGTSLYFHHEQFEPDVIYAARPNRAILYKANTLHCANYDIAYKQRIIQTIFF